MSTLLDHPIVDEAVTTFPLERPTLRVRRRDPHRFETLLPYFICGDENRLVSFVGRSESTVFEMGNPVLLTGPSGVGKSCVAMHLAAKQAIAMGIAGEVGGVLYLPAIDFARKYAEAVGADDLPPLRNELDEAPILVIDDLSLISDKSAAQDELASRLESRTIANKPTILTCRRLPSEIRSMRPLLVSRCLPGLTIPIRPPGPQARRLLLRELSIYRSVQLSDELLDMLSIGLDPNLTVRSLDAAIKETDLWSRMNETPPTAAAITSVIDTVGRAGEVSLQKITAAVAKRFRQKASDLRSSSRKQQIVRARSLAMFLARRLTSKSLHQIGDHFGGRDHSTVLHAIRKTESLIDDDMDLRAAAAEVTENITTA
tara:strand:+ start:157020 stop:158135 length:1116 start_codon:yes stop_codon:yes gene_type:complete